MSPALMALMAFTGRGGGWAACQVADPIVVLRGARQIEVHSRLSWSNEYGVRGSLMAFAETQLFTDGGLRILKAEDNGE
jgi:hypothetical protein